jgi:hypothetical protein
MCNGVNCMHKTTHRAGLSLRAPLGPDHLVEPADILDTKKTLMTLGYYEPLDGAEPGAWVDNDLFAGIKRFQRENGLKVDALLRPGGPTEAALNEALDEVPPPPANDDQPPANDDDPWNEAARGRRGSWWKGDHNKGPVQDESKDHKPSVPGGPAASTCWTLLNRDVAICKQRFPYPEDKPGYVRCESQAQKNFSDCLANRDVHGPLPGRPGR